MNAPATPRGRAGRQPQLPWSAAVVHEVLTGHVSGCASVALPKEPRPQYDTTLVPNLADRVAAKALELGCGERAIWALITSYRQRGIAAPTESYPRHVGIEPVKPPHRTGRHIGQDKQELGYGN